jgi:hypothetical protein
MDHMVMLKAGECAKVVDQDPTHDTPKEIQGNILRRLPVTDANNQVGLIAVNGIVKLLHGPYTDADGAIWWYVQVKTDPEKPPKKPDDLGEKGWMAELAPKKSAFANLLPAKCV